MSEVTEIIEEVAVQLEIIETNSGTIEIVGEDKTTIEIVENISSTNDLDISTKINTVVVDSNPSEGTSLNISEDSPTKVEVELPPVAIDIVDKILVSGTSELSFNTLVDRPFTVDGQNRITSQVDISEGISASGDIKANRIILPTFQNDTPPVYTFDGDEDTGMYHKETNGIGFQGAGTDILTLHPSKGALFSIPITSSNDIKVNGSITASGDISASGLLFISASEFVEADNVNLQINPNVLVYDTSSGRLFYTGSYGGTGDFATEAFVTTSISNSLLFIESNKFHKFV